MEDLGPGLLNGAELERLLENNNKPGQPAPSQSPSLVPDLDDLRKMLEPPQPLDGEDIGQQGESPLASISNQMARAESLIESQSVSGETREVQEQIVSELDKLIDQLNKQCQKCSGGQCNKPGQQQTQSSTPKPGQGKPQSSGGNQAQPAQSQVSQGGGGEAQPGDVADREVMKQLWGQLPERLRQQLLQSTDDEFLPKYREELEQYFRRLAEEENSPSVTP